MSSNFSFLNDTEPELCELATGAEQLVHESPTTALRELRTFGEVLIQRVLEKQPTQVRGNGSTQHDRLVMLERNGTLPDEVSTALHQIRMHGNDASHENTGTRNRAKRQLHNAWVAARWLQENYHSGATTPTGFNQPQSSDTKAGETDPDRVKSEVEALERRLEAVEGQQENADEVEQLKARIEELEAEKVSSMRSSQNPDSNVFNRIRRLGRWGKRMGVKVTRTAASGGRAVIRAVYGFIRFVGRTVRRTVKIAIALTLIGALLMYLPSVYSAGLNLFPKETAQSLPAAKTVEEGHAQVFPRRMRTRVEEAVVAGWMIFKKEGNTMLHSLRKDLSVYWKNEERNSASERK